MGDFFRRDFFLGEFFPREPFPSGQYFSVDFSGGTFWGEFFARTVYIHVRRNFRICKVKIDFMDSTIKPAFTNRKNN